MKVGLCFDVAVLASDGIAFQSDFDCEDSDKLMKCFIDFIMFADPNDEFSVVVRVKE